MSTSPEEDSPSKTLAIQRMGEWFLSQVTDPIKLCFIVVIIWLLKKILQHENGPLHGIPEPDTVPPLKKQDFTVQQLRKYDGSNEDGRILLAVNHKVYDVTRGKQFYGKDCPYGNLAGHDASRALAKFQIDRVTEEYDDLSDLDQGDMDQIREWDIHFSERHIYIGKLLKPGEEPTSYSDEDEDDDEEENANYPVNSTESKKTN